MTIGSIALLGVVGIVLFRLFSGKSTYKESVATISEANFKIRRTGLVLGIVVWPGTLVGTFMALGAGYSLTVYILFILQLIAEPLAIGCLILAYMQRKKNLQRAIFFLKLPFYYLYAFLAFVLVGAIIGSFVTLP